MEEFLQVFCLSHVSSFNGGCHGVGSLPGVCEPSAAGGDRQLVGRAAPYWVCKSVRVVLRSLTPHCFGVSLWAVVSPVKRASGQRFDVENYYRVKRYRLDLPLWPSEGRGGVSGKRKRKRKMGAKGEVNVK